MQLSFVIRVLSGPALCHFSHFLQLFHPDKPTAKGKWGTLTFSSLTLWRLHYYSTNLLGAVTIFWKYTGFSLCDPQSKHIATNLCCWLANCPNVSLSLIKVGDGACQGRWEVLRRDGRGTRQQGEWWAGTKAMLKMIGGQRLKEPRRDARWALSQGSKVRAQRKKNQNQVGKKSMSKVSGRWSSMGVILSD